MSKGTYRTEDESTEGRVDEVCYLVGPDGDDDAEDQEDDDCHESDAVEYREIDLGLESEES